MRTSCVVSVSLGAILASAFAVAETPCALCNGDFEAGLSAWHADGAFTVAPGEGRGGSAAVRWKRPEKTTAGEYLVSERLPAESGRIYRYSAWLRLGEKLVNGPVYVSASARDASGRGVGGVEGRPLIRQAQLKGKGWVEVTGALPRLPAGAATITVNISVPKNTAGEIFIDDFRVWVSDRRHVEYVFSSAYRDEAASGEVRFVAPYILEPSASAANDLAPAFVCVGAQGETLTLPADVLPDASFAATVDVAKLSAGANRVRAVLKTKAGKVFDAAELTFTRGSRSRKVCFDASHRMVVDGKPFLPLGMYSAELSDEDFAIYREAPFNTMFCKADCAALDRCAARGMKAVVSMTGIYDPAALDEKIAACKDHPAVLAWYTNDEIPPGFARRQAALQEVFRRVDPDHPTWTVLDKPWQVREFLTSFDVIGMDPYPIGNHRGGIDIAWGWARKCDAQAYGMRPMWQVPQAFDWRWFRDGLDDPEFRFPRPEEFRSMQWQAIAAGANGLMPYSFSAMRKKLKRPDAFAAAWETVKASMTEIARFESVILGDPAPAAVRKTSGDIGVRTWETDGARHLLVTSLVRGPRAYDIALARPCGKVTALLGDRPHADGPRLTGRLPPLGVALWRID